MELKNITIKEWKIGVNIWKHVNKSKDLIEKIKKIREDKELYFNIYDSLKGFDLIMSVVGKEKIVEYFVMYMTHMESTEKNYSKFLTFVWKKEWNDFFKKLRKLHSELTKTYNSIRFWNKSYHFGSEEVYLRETLDKMKFLLGSIWELKGKWNFMNVNSLLGTNNYINNFDFKFKWAELEQIGFYLRLDDLEEVREKDNLLPFFKLINTLMDEAKTSQNNIMDAAEEAAKNIRGDIKKLYWYHDEKEKEFIDKAKNEINKYLDKGDVNFLADFTKEANSILKTLDAEKNIPQWVIMDNTEILEESSEELKEYM